MFAEAEAADVQQQQVPSAYEFSLALDFPLEPAPAAEEDEATKATKACFLGGLDREGRREDWLCAERIYLDGKREHTCVSRKYSPLYTCFRIIILVPYFHEIN